MRERGINREVRFISCGGLVKKELLMQQIQMIMQLIQKEYDYPVDIEFTVNLSETGEYSINLLQCRPLQVFKDTGNVEIPDNIPEENIILENVHSSMGLARKTQIDTIVLIDPVAYYNMPYAKKVKAAKLLGAVNWNKKADFPDIIDFYTDDPDLKGVAHVYDTSKASCELCNDLQNEKLVLYRK